MYDKQNGGGNRYIFGFSIQLWYSWTHFHRKECLKLHCWHDFNSEYTCTAQY